MTVAFDQLAAACQTLFGPETAVSPAFVRYLRLPGLKAAFRSLAKKNHPDHAGALGLDPSLLEEKFRRIRNAYELLLPYVKGERRIPDAMQPMVSASTPVSNHTASADTFWTRRDWRYSGPLPERTLRFGEFLYLLHASYRMA
jgi:hypothetical protein